MNKPDSKTHINLFWYLSCGFLWTKPISIKRIKFHFWKKKYWYCYVRE